MKHKILAYAFIPMMGIGLVGTNIASAHGLFGGMGQGMGFGLHANVSLDEIATRQQAMFENEAKILGLSADDVKNAWAVGKNVSQLMEEKKIDKPSKEKKKLL